MESNYTLFYIDGKWIFHNDAPIIMTNTTEEVISKCNNTIYMHIALRLRDYVTWYSVYIDHEIDIVNDNNHCTVRLNNNPKIEAHFISLIEKLYDDEFPEATMKKLFNNMKRLLCLIADNGGIIDDEMVSAIEVAKKLNY